MLEKTIKQPIRLVALDTEVFVQANFHFQSKTFQKLIKLVRDEIIYIYLTTITHQEICDHIHREAKQSASAFKTIHKDFRKQAKIIFNSCNFKNLLSLKLEEEVLLNELKKQFSDFINESQIEILSVESVAPEYVFSKYFKSIPPFNQGKKKYEFPDAFAIAAIEIKAKLENKKIYVISGDKDWLEACNQSDHLIYRESIDKLLDDIVAQEGDEIHLCHKIFEDNLEVIKEEISSIFIEGEFSLSDDFAYGYLEPGSEYIEVVVDLINIIDKSIVDINNEEVEFPIITFELKTDISYTAHISYDSTEYAFWDSEDHAYYNIKNVTGKSKQKIVISVELEILLFRDESHNLCFNAIENVDLDTNGSIGTIVLVDEGFEENPEELDSCFSPDEYDDN
jgi:hypothetical protein